MGKIIERKNISFFKNNNLYTKKKHFTNISLQLTYKIFLGNVCINTLKLFINKAFDKTLVAHLHVFIR